MSLGHAQPTPPPTNGLIPVVNIVATEPVASRSGQPGQFTVFRFGDTNQQLLVYYHIGGTASNGVDYTQISATVTIPPGTVSNTITISPIDSGQTDAVQTVDLELAPPPYAPVSYAIGYPSNATVYIEGIGVTNIPPHVAISYPSNGQSFAAPANIPLVALAGDPDGYVTSVEFFAGTNSLGLVTNWVVVDPPFPPGFRPGDRAFLLQWTNVPVGSYVLTAVATDNGGASTISSPVDITVQAVQRPPLVTIMATTPDAAEPCRTNGAVPGMFTVYRDSGTNNPLQVFYAIGGTASNGLDYVAISNSVVIPEGEWSADIVINPLADGPRPVAVETVALQILPVACPAGIIPFSPTCYFVGQPSSAVVDIQQCNVVGYPPLVTIVATSPDAAEPCGTNAAVPGVFTVYRSSGTNNPLQVLYAIGGTASNGLDYATISNSVVIPEGAWSANIVINPLADGPSPVPVETVALQLLPVACPGGVITSTTCYVLGQPSSAVVNILQCNIVTNRGPMVRITSPPNGSVFRAPVNIPIVAFAWEPNGFVTGVEFFDGTNDLGPGHGLCLVANPVTPCPFTNLFVLVWSNALLGTNILTAVATDNSGVSAVSPPVQVLVLPPLPPPTNRPPVVSILANDPIAIEGTNCWPRPWAAVWPSTLTGPTAITFSNFCGPKDAQFTVLRWGETNDDITVSYAIGGTATNGVDYVALPGSVTILAGQRKALITIIPIDDGPPDITSTVILSLNTSAVTPTNNYVLGFPRRAEAIILDSRGPAPGTGMLPDGSFHVNAAGPDGAWFQIEYSADLVNWTPVCTGQVINGSVDFVDPDAPNDAARFYRAVPEAGPPSY